MRLLSIGRTSRTECTYWKTWYACANYLSTLEGRMKPVKLTAKQEAFCLAYLETGNASEAYRQVYKSDRMKSTTIARKAHHLMENGKIGARLDELRAPVRERAQMTLESHLSRLNELSMAAERAEQYSAAITAETNRGRAAGLYVERVDNTSSDGSMSPTRILLVAPPPTKGD